MFVIFFKIWRTCSSTLSCLFTTLSKYEKSRYMPLLLTFYLRNKITFFFNLYNFASVFIIFLINTNLHKLLFIILKLQFSAHVNSQFNTKHKKNNITKNTKKISKLKVKWSLGKINFRKLVCNKNLFISSEYIFLFLNFIFRIPFGYMDQSFFCHH